MFLFGLKKAPTFDLTGGMFFATDFFLSYFVSVISEFFVTIKLYINLHIYIILWHTD